MANSHCKYVNCIEVERPVLKGDHQVHIYWRHHPHRRDMRLCNMRGILAASGVLSITSILATKSFPLTQKTFERQRNSCRYQCSPKLELWLAAQPPPVDKTLDNAKIRNSLSISLAITTLLWNHDIVWNQTIITLKFQASEIQLFTHSILLERVQISMYE